MSDDAAFSSARDEFILFYVADKDAGRVRTEDEYRRLFPRCEDVIASEIKRLDEDLARRALVEREVPPRPSAPATWMLDRYRIEGELGSGGQGTVFLATDTRLGRTVALKVLKASWSGSSEMVARFEREARALARLDHSGLASVHDIGSWRGLEYIVMEYVEGRTLARELADRPANGVAAALTNADVIRYLTLIEKAARALHVAHEAGLVHRDVKPGNIMITPEDEPVVLDFGVVLLRETGAETLTLTGDVIGTPGFMAPEQVAGGHDGIDRRADVYALATMLRSIVAGPGVHVRLPRNLDAVLEVGSDPAPDRRYATAAAFADDLARVRNVAPVAVRPPGRLRKFAHWCRRAPAAAALVILTPIALIVSLIGLAIRNADVRSAAHEAGIRHAEADAAARSATERFTDYQRLNDLRRLEDLETREQELWPAHPRLAVMLERWLADAAEVLARLPDHRAALASLRKRGHHMVVRERGVDPVMDRLLVSERVRDAATEELRNPSIAGERSAHMTKVVEAARRRIDELEKVAASRPSRRYEAPEDQWLDDNLAELVARLAALDATSAYGCTRASLRKRLEAARSLERVTLEEPAAAWREAIAAIGNATTTPAYGGLAISPILGLVPIGRDRDSGLWEFAHVPSGVPPVRDAEGRLVITEASSIVLVLIPGGTVRMGARLPFPDEDGARDHVDPAATWEEAPVHEVRLDPFLISKYEMTQGQWLRATGSNPSHHRPDREWERDRPNLSHPVEQVSYTDCERTLGRMGLSIPTEAQWERAARAGTTTPWWPGETIDAFLTIENLSDSTLVEIEDVKLPHDAKRRDGRAGPAPVGTYPANPFGLHDVIGNVHEWCRDRMAVYTTPALPGDALRADGVDGMRPIRGGAFHASAARSRSSTRFGRNEETRMGTTGVRPSLALAPP